MTSRLFPLALMLLPSLAAADTPRLADSRYDIQLFAQAPDIVTPIGALTDARGRLYVVESHTLMPPEDYPGPKHDRIKVFEDTDRDGKPDKVTVFAEGFQSALRMVFGPDGALYVACSREIWKVTDTDGDGKADSRERLVRLESDDPFPWGYFDGLAFSPEGDLYFNKGFTSFSHRTVGSDGSSFSGYGDGGSVLRCRADGSKLEFFATGFWAPSAMAFDCEGHLLLLDNDPFSRGPNRLIHCADQGDYGFRIVYGYDGDSPLIGLAGELPGTLPPVTETAEAPSDILVCGRNRFPGDMGKSVLIGVWGDNAIERHELKSSGSVMESKRSVWAQGGADFKPVDLVADSSGVIYVTDWVKNDFRNHGEGRIWRIAPKADVALKAPRNPAASWKLEVPESVDAVRAGLLSEEPLIRHAATLALARPAMARTRDELSRDRDPRLRVGALVAWRRANAAGTAGLLGRFLGDSDESVRHAAAVWIGEARLTGARDLLERSLDRPDMTSRLLEASLAALAALDPEFVKVCEVQGPMPFEKLPHNLPDTLTHKALGMAQWTGATRSRVLPWLEDPGNPGSRKLLRMLAESAESPLNLHALEVLSLLPQAPDRVWISKLAADRGKDAALRAEALGLWSRQANAREILPLIDDPEEAVRAEAVIGLGRMLAADASMPPNVREQLKAANKKAGKRVRAEIRFALHPDKQKRPDNLTEWQKVLAKGGDPVMGRRRFFSAELQCVTCHRIEGIGGRVGPDLGMVARSQTRADIIRSILRPSEYFGPEFQTWEIERPDGEVISGALLGVDKDGTATVMLTTGDVRVVPGTEVKHMRGLSTSIMPSGLEMAMSVESLRDIVAFLATMK